MATSIIPAAAEELQGRISACATSRDGTARVADARTVEGTLTAITAKWFLGGRTVTNTFRCVLDRDTHTVHFHEHAAESSWGLPPPTFTMRTSTQYGTRVNESRTDTAPGGGGHLEFGRFREDVERVTCDSGWTFSYELA